MQFLTLFGLVAPWLSIPYVQPGAIYNAWPADSGLHHYVPLLCASTPSVRFSEQRDMDLSSHAVYQTQEMVIFQQAILHLARVWIKFKASPGPVDPNQWLGCVKALMHLAAYYIFVFVVPGSALQTTLIAAAKSRLPTTPEALQALWNSNPAHFCPVHGATSGSQAHVPHGAWDCLVLHKKELRPLWDGTTIPGPGLPYFGKVVMLSKEVLCTAFGMLNRRGGPLVPRDRKSVV